MSCSNIVRNISGALEGAEAFIELLRISDRQVAIGVLSFAIDAQGYRHPAQ
jgi:hypothetical protein